MGGRFGSHDLLKFWEISANMNISETVQNRYIGNHMSYQMAPTSVTLSDLENHFSCLKYFYLPFIKEHNTY